MALAPPDHWNELLESLAGDRDVWWEVIDGIPMEKPRKGAQADRIIVDLLTKLHSHASAGGHGLCFSGRCGYEGIFPHDSKRLRYPSISFLRTGRLPEGPLPRGHLRVVPDLIVEVVSFVDVAEAVNERLADFSNAGVPLAWMIYPMTKQVYVFHQGPASLRLGLGDVLEGEDVLPGFSCALNDLFAGI